MNYLARAATAAVIITLEITLLFREMDYLALTATVAVIIIAFYMMFLGRRRRSSDHSNDDTSSQQSDSTPDSVDFDSVPLPIGEYEVFLSFRGPDTHNSITNILYHFLTNIKIHTFMDDGKLRKGEGIWPNLVEAIGQSKISIPIFSPCYAESKWCLKELAEIVEHKKRENGHIILPIFYMVDPRDVRHQTGPYEVAFQQHERNTNFDEKTIETWKAALTEVGSLKGWHIKTKEEEVDVAKVVYRDVWSHLSKNNNKLEINELVGIDDHVQQIEDMLDLGSQGVNLVGLHGMGGIGKTTLATAVYNKVSAYFDRYSYVKDIRETQKQHDGVLILYKKLISNILRMDSVESIVDISEAKKIIRERITRFKILVVLDDVDEKFKFEEVLGDPESFASGSRFIVTSRDIKVLRRLSECQSRLYGVQGMNHDHSLKLFCKHAFKKDSPQSGFEALSNAIISTAGGLPLTLKVIGSLLYREEEEVWNDKLKQLKKIPEDEVMERLKISYDGLRYEAQQIFLDIACFYIGENKEITSYMWSDCNFHPISNINILVQRSMLNIGDENEFLMHDQLRDMGREIVRREDIERPWMRSRIWSYEEARELLLNNKGTNQIKSIRLANSASDLLPVRSSCFTDMSELRYFAATRAELIGNFNQVLPNLKWMELRNCNANYPSLPTLNVKNLIVEYPRSKEANKLKVLILSGCPYGLPEFPESGSLEILEIYDFEEDLKIEKLQNLKVLKLGGCIIGKIKGGTIGTMMKGLRELHLTDIGCDYEAFRQTIVDIEKLSLLQILTVNLKDVLEGIKLPKSLKKLHTSSGFANVEELLELEEFTIWDGTELVIPPAAGSSRGGDTTSSTIIPWIHSSKLKEIYLYEMVRIIMVESKDITMLPSSLTKVTIDSVDTERIPNLKNLWNLTELEIEKCPNLEEIQGMGGLKSLQVLRIVGAQKLTRIHGLGNLMSSSNCKLTELYIDDCPLLREVVTFEQQDDDDGDGGSEGERERYVLVQIESLVRMTIANSPSIDCRSIPRLSKFPMLKYLTIKNIGLNINEESVSQQRQHQQLEGLVDLSISNVDSNRILNLKNLVNLTTLHLEGCHNLEEVQGMEGLKSLEVLRIVVMEKLTRIHGLGYLMSSSNCELTTMEICKCPLLREIVTFEQQDDDDGDGGSEGERERYVLVQIESLVTMEITKSPSIDWRSIPKLSKFPMLKYLTIGNINEESVSQQRQHQQLEGLVDLSISNVDSKRILNLKNLWNLTELEIEKCPNLEEIQGMGGLKSLQVLRIVGAQKLTRIHGLGNLMSSSNCKLTELYICGCPLLRDVVTFEKQDDDGGGDDDGDGDDEDVLVKMEILEIPSIGGGPTPRLSKLPMVKYMKSSELTIALKETENIEDLFERKLQFSFLSKLNKRLYYLVLEDVPALLEEIVGAGDMKELCLIMNDCLSSERLHIKDLPYSNVDSNRILNLKNLVNLTTLNIEVCPNLEEIQGMGGLKSLQVLRIVGAQKLTRIHGLGNLMSSSNCKLTELYIVDCPLLREVVTFEQQDDDDGDGGSEGERERYVLVQIESLVTMRIWKSPSVDWRSIPRLSKFPMLKYLTINNIGLNINEESASKQGQHQLLEGLENLRELVQLKVSNVDSKLILNLKNLGNLTELKLSKCPNLEEIHGMEGLKSLHVLCIEGARKLTRIHGLGNLMSSSNCELTLLVISECPLLREVVTFEQQDEESVSQQRQNQQLEGLVDLSISNVDSKQILNLKNLGNLTTLHLEGCHNLEEVQGMEGLKSLQILKIEGARKLTCIHGLGNLMSCSSCELTELVIRECPLLREVGTLEQQDDDDDDDDDGGSHGDDFLLKMKILEIPSIDFSISTTPMLSKLPMFKYMKCSEYRMVMKGTENQNPEYNFEITIKIGRLERLSYLRLEDLPALQEIVGPGFFKSLWGLMNECFSFEIKDLPYSSLHRIEFDSRRNTRFKFIEYDFDLSSLSTEGGNLGEVRFAITWPYGEMYDMSDADSNPELSSSISSMEVVEAPEHGLLERRHLVESSSSWRLFLDE